MRRTQILLQRLACGPNPHPPETPEWLAYEVETARIEEAANTPDLQEVADLFPKAHFEAVERAESDVAEACIELFRVEEAWRKHGGRDA